MTPKEALEIVKIGSPVGFEVPLYHQALDIMGNLIAKAEPMKPVIKKGWFVCNSCNKLVAIDEKFCSQCGQALDWSDEK
jgi:hypothetical protein